MSGMLTTSILTREFIHLLDGCLRALHPIEFRFPLERPQFTQETSADVVILPDHLKTKTLNDISEQLLIQAATKMAEDLKDAHADAIFNPPILDGFECSIQRYNGLSVRGAVMRGVEIDGLIVDAFRFTVFYREAQLQ
jgi:hypothetical protein